MRVLAGQHGCHLLNLFRIRMTMIASLRSVRNSAMPFPISLLGLIRCAPSCESVHCTHKACPAKFVLETSRRLACQTSIDLLADESGFQEAASEIDIAKVRCLSRHRNWHCLSVPEHWIDPKLLFQAVCQGRLGVMQLLLELVSSKGVRWLLSINVNG